MRPLFNAHCPDPSGEMGARGSDSKPTVISLNRRLISSTPLDRHTVWGEWEGTLGLTASTPRGEEGDRMGGVERRKTNAIS